MSDKTPTTPPEDRLERRVRFFLGVFIITLTFVYILAAAFTQGTDRPLSLPDWKYAIPFVFVAFIVVFQVDTKDLRFILRLIFGGAMGAVREAMDESKEEKADVK